MCVLFTLNLTVQVQSKVIDQKMLEKNDARQGLLILHEMNDLTLKCLVTLDLVHTQHRHCMHQRIMYNISDAILLPLIRYISR